MVTGFYPDARSLPGVDLKSLAIGFYLVFNSLLGSRVGENCNSDGEAEVPVRNEVEIILGGNPVIQ